MEETRAPPAPPAGTRLGARLRAARDRSFIGRRTELDLFRAALEADVPPFAILHLHGPGGIGKTALLHRFDHAAREADREPVLLDGRSVAASPAGFRAALATAFEVDADDVDETLLSQERPVLLLDTYEALTPLDGWLRDTLIPKLPERALIVLASRNPPTAGWRADPGWGELLRVIALRDLHAGDARALLHSRGIAPSRHAEALRVARGYPLALVLVAEVLAQHGEEVPFTLQGAPEVIDALLQRFLRQVPTGAHRRALYAAAHIGIATEALIRDTVDGVPAGELFDWLRGLSFTEPAVRGVVLHDLVSDALNAELRWRDPEGWIGLHESVTEHLEGLIARTTGVDQQRAVLDFLQLYRFNPVTRRFFDWDRTQELWVEPAAPEDHAAILSLTREREGDDSAELARYWLERQPEAFSVFHGVGGGEPMGFVAHLLLDGSPGEEVDIDPVVAVARDHVRACAPMRSGEKLRILRFWIARTTYQDISTHHLVSARSSLDWATTDQMAWSLVVLSDPDFYEPLFAFIEFDRPAELEVTVGAHSYGMFARDWRVSSRRAWRDLMRDRRVSSAERVTQLPAERDRLLVLAHEDFVEAVRDALRRVARPGELEGSSLLRSRIVVERADDRPGDEILAELLQGAADELSTHPREEKMRRALELTYFRPAPTQEAAAQRLDLPFSTFRRHLTAAVEHVASRLWALELHGDTEQP